MAEMPEIPQELLDQVLADPEAVAALQELAGRAGVTTPVAEMDRAEQVALVTAMIGAAQRAEAQSGNGAPEAANNNAPSDPAAIPEGLIQQVFSDPRADEILRDIMANNQLAGEPADLDDEIKRAIVQMLIDQGVISFQDM